MVCDDFLRNHGIKHQLIAIYTSQQNGMAERKNKSIMDMVRWMIKSKISLKVFGQKLLLEQFMF